mgnify:CR=1 FL=1
MVNTTRRIVNIKPKVDPPTTPQCCRQVDLSPYYEHYIVRRKRRCEKLGYDPTLCTRQSSYTIDGEHLCTEHARQIALKILIQEEI